MFRNRVWLLAAILTLSIALSATTAPAWEFAMDGTFTWKYDHITQMGNNGFFGPYDVDNSGAFYQTANGWLGQRSGYGSPGTLVSGADYARNSEYMNTNIEIRINPALRLRGTYYVGEWAPIAGTAGQYGVGNLVASENHNYRFGGIQRSFSPGYWNTLWMTAQLPWGTLSYGKRPSIWGTGLAWNGAENRSSEQFTLVAPFGPIRVQMGFYPARRASTETSSIAAPNAGVDYFNLDGDKNNLRNYDVTFPNVTYRSGPLDMGAQFTFVRTQRGNERFLGINRVTAGRQTRDRDDFYGGAYVKYNNGRFFWNSEFDWYNRIDRYSGNAGPLNTRNTAPVYLEGYRMMAETGVVCGPSKLAFLYAWLGGTDRRGNGIAGTANNGLNGINQGTFNDPTSASAGVPNPIYQSQTASNTGVFRPYSYLMVYNYGLGAFFNADTGNGYADDASIFAARLDYAIAANLNAYGSFFWADRVGNAYGWGFLAPKDRTNVPSATVFGLYRGTSTVRVPTIPDNNLGWEIDAGFDWKLLEGLNVNFTAAYWQPGQWFNYACIDKANPTWLAAQGGGAANNWGTIPDRSIDPILGFELMLVGEF